MTKKILLIAAIILTLAFIWGNSMIPIPESRSASDSIDEYIRPVIARLFGDEAAESFDIRKPAHFCEFALLALELVVFLGVFGVRDADNLIHILFFGLGTAVIDEAIQILSSRGPMVSDILLDFTGFAAGFVFTLALVRINKARKKHKV